MKQLLLWGAISTISSVLYGCHPLLLKLTLVDGRIPYQPAALVLFVELGKLLISFVLLLLNGLRSRRLQSTGLDSSTVTSSDSPSSTTTSPVTSLINANIVWTLAKCSIPACLYALNNSIAIYSQLWLDTVSYQVLGNSKIVATVIVYKLVLQRQVGRWRLLAVCLVTAVGVLNGLAGQTDRVDDSSQLTVTLVGVSLMIVLAVSSAVASVITEKFLTDRSEYSVHVWNCGLYGAGTLVNLLVVVSADLCGHNDITNSSAGLTLWGSLVEGMSPLCWLVVACQILSGLRMSMVLRHATNMLRIMIIGWAVPVNIIGSVLLFSVKIPALLYVALLLLAAAFVAYTMPPPPPSQQSKSKHKTD